MKKILHFTIPHGWILGCLAPVAGYVIFETTTGNLTAIHWNRALMNIAFYYLLYALVYLVLNRFRTAVAGTTAVLYLIAAVDYYVLQFKGSPLLLPQDLTAWRTAAAVVSNYEITPAASVVTGGVLLAVFIFLICHVRVKRLKWKQRGGCAVVYVLCCALWLTAFYKYDIKYTLADIDDDVFWWSLDGSYRDFGYAVSTAILVKSMVFEKPEGYTPEAAEEAAQDIQYTSHASSDTVPENLIVIMNESLADMRVIGDFETNEEFFPFISSLEENTVKGNLYVQVFGGGTSNTEYEVLTGHSMSFLPYVISAFQAYCKPPEYGLVTTLKDQGYTAVAMHPNISGNWNRKNVYSYMEFDEFLSSGEYREAERLRDYVSDLGNYQRLIERYEEKEEGERLFVFNVTMQNHGGYEYGADNFQEEIRMTGELAGYEQTDRYLSLMKKSDEAFAYLLEYFSEVEEPTMIVMFGDHQAAVETEVYESLFGKPLSELSPEEADRRYITPLIIWTNYEQQEGWIDKISANYLGSLILDLANLELTPYNQILLETWEELPAFGKNGYYLADGSYVAWSADTEEPEQMRRYHLIEYNGVADRRNRRDVLFRIEPQGGM